jgi:hypothetical protein
VSDVRAYVPGGTGTLADVVEQGPELKQSRPAGPDSFAPPPSWSQLFTAARPEALRSTPLYDDVKIGEGYAPIVDALGLPASENPGYFGDLDDAGQARFGSAGSPSRLATSARQGERIPFGAQYLADRSLQESLILSRIKAQRLIDKNFLPGVPDDAEGLHRYFEQQQAAKRAAGASVLARGTTFGRVTAGIAAGGLESALHDPITLPTLVLGGGTASSVVQAAGRDALINGVLAAAEQPIVAHNMAENDEHLTAGDVVSNVASSAAFGAAFGAVVHGVATHVPPALFHIMPESVQTRWADRMRIGPGRQAPLLKEVLGDMDNRELATFARSSIGAERMTPDEKAAATVIERNQELGEASPFEPGPAGDAAHAANLGDALQSIIDGVSRERPAVGPLLASSALRPPGVHLSGPLDLSRAGVPHDIVDFLKAKGLDDAHAYGIAAGIAAEARGGDHTAVNPKSGAMGLGQWLGSRKAELIRRYGANPSRAQQLEFLWHELNGGDPGGAHVLAAKDAGSVLDAYIRKFMRPAAGAETIGDLDRGMAALGHKGELPESAAIGAGEDDALAALRRDADQAEQEALDLQSGRAGADAELGVARQIDAADYPILKRQLFDSDRDWAEAQVGFYRAQGLLGEPAGAPLRHAEAAPGATTVAGTVAALSHAGEDRAQLVESLEHDIRMEVRAATARAADAILRRSQAAGKLPRSPKSLLDFIAARGGIEDVGGDLAAMNIERWHREKPFRRKLLRDRPHHAEPGIAYSKNNAPDQLFQAAIDADYFPELNRTRLAGATDKHLPDLNAFYEAIDEELRGNPRYSSEDHAAVFERARADENNAWIADKLDTLQGLADEWGIGLDEGALGHAVDAIARGSSPEEALHSAVEAAAMRDLATAMADTGDLRYGVDNSGRRWDDEVNYAEHRDPAADGRAPDPGERRSPAQAADQAAGRSVTGEPESAAGESDRLERRYRLAPDGEPQTLKEILDQLDRERDAVAALRSCAEPGGGE